MNKPCGRHNRRRSVRFRFDRSPCNVRVCGRSQTIVVRQHSGVVLFCFFFFLFKRHRKIDKNGVHGVRQTTRTGRKCSRFLTHRHRCCRRRCRRFSALYFLPAVPAVHPITRPVPASQSIQFCVRYDLFFILFKRLSRRSRIAYYSFGSIR